MDIQALTMSPVLRDSTTSSDKSRSPQDSDTSDPGSSQDTVVEQTLLYTSSVDTDYEVMCSVLVQVTENLLSDMVQNQILQI